MVWPVPSGFRLVSRVGPRDRPTLLGTLLVSGEFADTTLERSLFQGILVFGGALPFFG